jgi:hypothetical protein
MEIVSDFLQEKIEKTPIKKALLNNFNSILF